ncbi:MAG: hypothetical protein N0E59_15585 [Candidatus Thiodiazotropha taylori]|nr:hypothetical protein [Candidatus Thiodiazotropha taylori]
MRTWQQRLCGLAEQVESQQRDRLKESWLSKILSSSFLTLT